MQMSCDVIGAAEVPPMILVTSGWFLLLYLFISLIFFLKKGTLLVQGRAVS